MTEQAVARRVPWATIIGWVALVLAVVGATGAVVAGVFAVEGARNPQSFGTLGAVVLLMASLIPSVPALVAGIVQARQGRAPRWRNRTTVVLAALAPAAAVVLLLAVAVRDLVG
ncbi:hypothetical protein [Cellulomonas xylanilytica]|uniref:Uncharacterized protein n=1 Tax=Cellulomonas xylanilytica TaxID=233583 RepID=A0A510V4K1_9CELL|nr:hypothetical protein [Cellulomonas xylanilytica]GEK21798.1 hypothetical protein CXY01_23180 [Cellulomonas xylanilytica]